jgi:lipopolysaccharide/colanic/teichoic acid biosynthesis glycosyltransferase/O-antigen ligase
LADTLLVSALFFRLIALGRGRVKTYLPRLFWFWMPWAALEVFVWLRSPELQAGFGEIRHLFLIAALFLLIPALDLVSDRVIVWRGIVLVATISSMVLIVKFAWRLLFYKGNLDPIIYLRGGGLLHHWMVYATVEILVFAALLQLWHFYPEDRWWLFPVCIIHSVAIIFSLTRMLWICCLLVLAAHFVWTKSRWVWAVPAIPILIFFLAPSAVRSRVTDSAQPEYYSNAERLQMLHVGWQMIREKPWTGVGPGRVDALYTNYLSSGDPIPAYHGHLHNNLVQLGAQFGLPVVAAALVFFAVLLRDLRKRYKVASDRNEEFLCRTSLLSVAGFVVAGIFDYTYGHSLGLTLLTFAVLSPLAGSPAVQPREERHEPLMGLSCKTPLAAVDRFLGLILLAVLSPVIVAAGTLAFVLSRRSPFVAHRRIGRQGQPFWVWKIRTMWPKGSPLPPERRWVQRIASEPTSEIKPKHDPRVTSRFGAFCRRYSIDELPQLFQVIRGEMSLVGPRPVTRGELDRHYGPSAEQILRVKPGLTGYWQTKGRNRLTYPERVQLDLKLIRDLSFRVYWQVVLGTIPAVLSGKDAW